MYGAEKPLEALHILWFMLSLGNNLYYMKIEDEEMLPVQEYTADIVMIDRWFLGACSHPQGPEETVHKDIKLMDIFCLCLHHVEYNLIPLPHTFRMWRTYIVLHDCLPFPSTKPAAHKTLNLDKHKNTT